MSCRITLIGCFLIAAIGCVCCPSLYAAPLDVSGKVVASTGAAASGAYVRLVSLDCETGRLVSELSQQAGPDGAFQFHVPDSMTSHGPKQCRGLYLFAAKGAEAVIMDIFDDSFKEKTLPLQKTVSVPFRAVDDQGSAVKGLPVAVSMIQTPGNKFSCSWSQSAGSPWAAITDQDGKAVIANVPVGSFVTVKADSPDWVSVGDIRLDNLIGKPLLQEIRVARPGTIAGMVFYSGTNSPVPNISVTLVSQGNFGSRYQAQTDQDGVYSLDRVRPGIYTVCPSVYGALSEDWAAVAKDGVEVKPGQHLTNIDLSLIKGALLTGKATDRKTGNPVTDLQINIMSQSLHGAQNSFAQVHKDGVYRIRLAPGAYLVRDYQGNPGMLRWDEGIPVSLTDGETKTLDLTVDALPAPRTIHGVVVDASGNPVAGAIVSYNDRGAPRTTEVSDAQGRFTFDSVRPGNTVGASTRDFLGSSLAVAPDSDAPVKLVLDHPMACMEGVVDDQDGKPVSGVLVQMTAWPDGTQGAGFYVGKTVTDENGRYRLGPTFPGFSYSVSVAADGYLADNSLDARIASQNSHLAMDPIKIARLDGEVRGIVTDDDTGKPLDGVSVWPNGQMAFVEPGQGSGSSVTDNLGRFVLKVPSGKPVQLWARKDGYNQGQMMAVRAGDNDIEIGLRKSKPVMAPPAGDCRVSGRIVDQNGQPIAGLRVQISAFDPSANQSYFASRITGADGRFEIAGITDKLSYSLYTSLNGYMEVQRYGVKAVRSGGSFPEDIVAKKLDSSIAGRCVDPAGQPVAGATISVTGVWTGRPTETAADGSFQIAVPKGPAVEVRARSRTGLYADVHGEPGADNLLVAMIVPAMHGDGTPAKTVLAKALQDGAAAGKGVLIRLYRSDSAASDSLYSGQALAALEKYFVIANIDTYETNESWTNAGWDRMHDPKTGQLIQVRYFAAFDASGGLHVAPAYPAQQPDEFPHEFVQMLKSAAPGMTDADLHVIQTAFAATLSRGN